MAKIVLTDYNFNDLDIEYTIFGQTSHRFVPYKQSRNAAQLPEIVRDADAILTQFAPLNAEVIAQLERAKVIVRYGIGVDNIDLEAARAKGIPVCNVPAYCIAEVADHTLAFILSLTRQVIPNTLLLREGGWGIATPVTGMQALQNLTVGVIGFGQIGRAVIQRLSAFSARVIVFDPLVSPSAISSAGAEAVTSLDALLPVCDVVTPHCPSTPQTRKMFNAAAFATMKTGAIFINVGRGDLVESGALVAALQSGKLSGAALDVFDPEPIPSDSPLRKMPNVILSAHIAAASPKALQSLRETAAGLILKALRSEPLPSVVNGKHGG